MSDKRAPGRPRAFDRDAALECAMRVFWEKGYAGASFRDLTTAMAISPPSLCAAFGDKHALFLEAVDRYAASAAMAVGAVLGRTGDLPTDLAALFAFMIDRAASPTTPNGCLLSCVLADAAETDPAARTRLAASIAELDQALAARFAAAGCGPDEARTRAGLAAGCLHGLALRARGHLTRRSAGAGGRRGARAQPVLRQ